MREALGRAALVLFGIAAGVVLFDMALRRALDVYRCDPRLGWTFEPGKTALWISRSREFWNVVRINSLGLHDAERSLEKPPGTFRILLLGDSFVASLQVPAAERFSERTERALAADVAPGRRIEVVNAGVDGYGTAQELLLLRELGVRMQPDLVLLGVFLANDVADNAAGARPTSHRLVARCGRPSLDGSGRLLPARVSADGWRRALLQRSALYAVWDVWRAPAATREAGDALADWDVYDPTPSPVFEQAWTLTRALVLQIREELRPRGVPLAVLGVPDKREIGLRNPWDLAREEDVGRARSLLRGFLASEGIPLLDLAPVLASGVGPHVRSAEQLPYYVIDSHWTPRGHALVAEGLTDWLRAHCAELGIPLVGCGGAPALAVP